MKERHRLKLWPELLKMLWKRSKKFLGQETHLKTGGLAKRRRGADVFFHLFPTLSSLYFLLLPFSYSLAPLLLLMEAATSRGVGAPQPPY